MVGEAPGGGGGDGDPLPISTDDAPSLLRPNAGGGASGNWVRRVSSLDRGAAGYSPVARQNACACRNDGQTARCFVSAGWNNGWSYCGGAAFGCAFSGKLYFGCLGGSCVAAIGAYTLQEARGYWNRCVA